MTNETNKPNASEALTRPTDLITCGLYIPHDKLVGIIKNGFLKSSKQLTNAVQFQNLY